MISGTNLWTSSFNQIGYPEVPTPILSALNLSLLGNLHLSDESPVFLTVQVDCPSTKMLPLKLSNRTKHRPYFHTFKENDDQDLSS